MDVTLKDIKLAKIDNYINVDFCLKLVTRSLKIRYIYIENEFYLFS